MLTSALLLSSVAHQAQHRDPEHQPDLRTCLTGALTRRRSLARQGDSAASSAFGIANKAGRSTNCKSLVLDFGINSTIPTLQDKRITQIHWPELTHLVYRLIKAISAPKIQDCTPACQVFCGTSVLPHLPSRSLGFREVSSTYFSGTLRTTGLNGLDSTFRY